MSGQAKYIQIYLIKWLIFATLVGFGGGISALALSYGIDWLSQYGVKVPTILAPAIGGLIVILIYKIDREVAGSGTRNYINAINLYQGQISRRTWLTKLIASSATIGFRGSGGVEGPMVLMGGSVGNMVSKLPLIKKLIDKEDHRILAVCGAAGAIGAVFRSPLGGGVFVAEILYKSSMHYLDMFPAILSSTMGFVIYSTLGTADPLFSVSYYLPEPTNVGYFIIAGLVAGFVSLLFMGAIHYAEQFSERFGNKKIGQLMPVFGGLLTGMILLFLPQVGGTGINFIQDLIEQSFGTLFLILVLIAKILATAFTVGLKASAGLVVPALFIGATTGAIVGNLFAAESGLASSLVVAGMSASLAATANVPIAAAILLIEMVGFQVGVAAVVGSVIGYVIGRRKMIYLKTSGSGADFRSGKDFRKLDRYFE
ncbi:chloride channel protein [Amphibacillus indicireducens]|uniref:Chloride channel protein n=1 Tax=Amphibacillus indicireducens TaxID=1076330 RepID=A0ABP7W2F3_9BACI